MKDKKKEVTKNCGNCINFDNGICDFNGWVVEEDDYICHGKGWEEDVNERK